MVAANEFQERADEIKRLIADDRTEQAMGRLMDFVRDFSDANSDVNEVTVISGSYTRLEKVVRQDRLSFSEAERERNKLLYQALELMDSIELEAARTIAA